MLLVISNNNGQRQWATYRSLMDLAHQPLCVATIPSAAGEQWSMSQSTACVWNVDLIKQSIGALIGATGNGPL